MKFFITVLACAALANAGGIPSYSISEIQPDRSIQITRGATLGAPLLTKTLGSPLGYAESAPLLSNGYLSNGLWSNGLVSNGYLSNGLISNGYQSNGLISNGYLSNGLSRSIISEPTLLSTKTLGVPLAEPIALAAPRTILTRAEPILTSSTKIIRSQPLITRSWASPSLLSTGLIGGPALLAKSPLSLGYGYGLSAPLAEPTILSAPLSKTIVTRSEPIISSGTIIRSEPTLLSNGWLGKGLLAEPTLLSNGGLIGDGLIGGKVWLKK